MVVIAREDTLPSAMCAEFKRYLDFDRAIAAAAKAVPNRLWPLFQRRHHTQRFLQVLQKRYTIDFGLFCTRGIHQQIFWPLSQTTKSSLLLVFSSSPTSPSGCMASEYVLLLSTRSPLCVDPLSFGNKSPGSKIRILCHLQEWPPHPPR